jgi:hypothetical protein
MRAALLSPLAAAALAALAPVGHAASSPSCGVAHAGPGAGRGSSGRGALCLLRAFEGGCASASYRLSVFGVDTIAIDSFSLRSRGGHCEVVVAASFEVVPQRRRLVSGVCATLQRRARDVVAGGCVGTTLPGTISLTGAG